MCGRFIANTDHAWQNFFTLKKPPPRFESYNIAPTQVVPVVRAGVGGNDCELLRWGLIPFFAKGVVGTYSTINARIESMDKSAAYRGPWKRAQRCIVPANGFYEWHLNPDGKKQPFYIHCNDQQLFGFAGLWDSSQRDDGEVIESCTIITMAGNPLLAEIHNAGSNPQRMPAILAAEDHAAWLSGSADEARAVLKQYPADLMVAWPVSTQVNSPRNNGPELTQRIQS